jgi:hypothetical protein
MRLQDSRTLSDTNNTFIKDSAANFRNTDHE